jgi:hypothetical protein
MSNEGERSYDNEAEDPESQYERERVGSAFALVRAGKYLEAAALGEAAIPAFEAELEILEQYPHADYDDYNRFITDARLRLQLPLEKIKSPRAAAILERIEQSKEERWQEEVARNPGKYGEVDPGPYGSMP